MPPKSKGGRSDAAKGSPAAAAAGGTSTDQQALAAAKQAADLLKEFRKKNDPKLLPKMEAAVEAAQTASAYLCLVKFCLLMAADLSMKKGRGPPWAEAGRMAEIDTAGRERSEEELEGELVALLTKALKAAAAGFLAKDRSYTCLVFAVQLAGVLRARGSPADLEERGALVQRLQKSVGALLRLVDNKDTFKLVNWLGADKEATPPPRWPLEVTISTVALKTQQEARGHLLHLWNLLRKCEGAEVDALMFAGGRGVGFLGSATAPIETIIDDARWEGIARVQERLVAWNILPLDERHQLGRKYDRRVSGDGKLAAAAREQQSRKVTRDQAIKAQRQEERKQSLAEKAKTASEELQRKAKVEAEAAAEAAAKRARVQEERAAAAREYLGPRVAAVADQGQEAQESALVAQLRMPVAGVRAWLQRQAQAKERSEADLAASRAALEKLASGKSVFYACWPSLAAAVAAPEYGGRGPAALRGTAGMVMADDNHKRCAELLLKVLQSDCDDVMEMIARKYGGRTPHFLTPLARVLRSDREIGMELEDHQLSANALEPGYLLVDAEGDPPAEADLALLARASREGLPAGAALVYHAAAEDFKQYNLMEGCYSFADVDAEDEQQALQAQQALQVAAAEAAAAENRRGPAAAALQSLRSPLSLHCPACPLQSNGRVTTECSRVFSTLRQHRQAHLQCRHTRGSQPLS